MTCGRCCGTYYYRRNCGTYYYRRNCGTYYYRRNCGTRGAIMERSKQIEIMRGFCDSMRDAIIAGSATWPDDWDGHELRELAATAFDSERTTLMRSNVGRKRRFNRANVNRWNMKGRPIGAI